MKELNNILLQFCFLIILIFFVILIKEYPYINKNNILQNLKINAN